jgi:hypothetical protein
VHRARPRECVSCAEVLVGCGSYVEQRLNTRRVLGGLQACQYCTMKAADCAVHTILKYRKLGGGGGYGGGAVAERHDAAARLGMEGASGPKLLPAAKS